jgi:hypothetical protein
MFVEPVSVVDAAQTMAVAAELSRHAIRKQATARRARESRFVFPILHAATVTLRGLMEGAVETHIMLVVVAVGMAVPADVAEISTCAVLFPVCMACPAWRL